jgi:hypothetical protein
MDYKVTHASEVCKRPIIVVTAWLPGDNRQKFDCLSRFMIFYDEALLRHSNVYFETSSNRKSLGLIWLACSKTLKPGLNTIILIMSLNFQW